MRDQWDYYETQADGTPKSGVDSFAKLSDVRLRVSLVCPQMTSRQFQHFAALAFAAPNGPGVDITQWSGNGDARRMIFSARLRYVKTGV